MNWDDINYTFSMDGWVVMQAAGKLTSTPVLGQSMYIDAEFLGGLYIVISINATFAECVVGIQRKLV